jgi:exodeoxyribonuclease VII large subunit
VAKQASSQEASLFDSQPQSVEKPVQLTVTDLTRAIRDVLEPAFTDVTIEGEISNFLHHRSGHRYWTLKDEGSQISCTFWKTRQLSFDIADGQKVLCRGRVTIYPPRGNYQLDVFQVRPLGIGALQLAYERLLKKLQEEGLFEESRKRPIPRFPKKIGIVTSSTGAALHDILTVLRRRYPLVEVLLRPSAVQGVGAELEIAQGIKDLNRLPAPAKPDVLIVGRGGGSLEDLWCFNEEAVARAIYGSGIPVISAVGHEVDVTIADFVADLRAPTPTAAAELATPDKAELLSAMASASGTIALTASKKLDDLKAELLYHLSGYGLKQRVSEALEGQSREITGLVRTMRSETEHKTELASLRLGNLSTALKTLDPTGVLRRGYAIVRGKDGAIVSKARDFPSDSAAEVVFSDGSVNVIRK